MKTRIISGIVMAALVAAVLAAGQFWPPVITGFIALLCAAAVYEMLRTAVGLGDRSAVAGGCVYACLAVLSADVPILEFTALTVLYFLFAVVMVLKNHGTFSLAGILGLIGMPVFISYAFGSLGQVINRPNGLYYLLLLLNFSSVCDMGAYFVGSACGKHKLCPKISPKKTVEGAVGGILSAVAVSALLGWAFGQTDRLVPLLLLTVPFCVIGMLGDLFASSIKRSVGIKDYGRLIPGHGGVLDRVDSVLLIAPVLYLCIERGTLL